MALKTLNKEKPKYLHYVEFNCSQNVGCVLVAICSDITAQVPNVYTDML